LGKANPFTHARMTESRKRQKLCEVVGRNRRAARKLWNKLDVKGWKGPGRQVTIGNGQKSLPGKEKVSSAGKKYVTEKVRLTEGRNRRLVGGGGVGSFGRRREMVKGEGDHGAPDLKKPLNGQRWTLVARVHHQGLASGGGEGTQEKKKESDLL